MPMSSPEEHFPEEDERSKDPSSESFNLFEALEAANGDPSELVLNMFLSLDLLRTFDIDTMEFQNLVRGAQTCYTEKRHRGNGPPPYHSFVHAVDVTQCAFVLIHQTEASMLLSKELKLATLLAALMHDCGHAGVNTAFLVNTADALVQQYGPEGTMEKYHAAVAHDFLVQQMAEGGALRNLEHAVQTTLLASVNELILATDMGSHQLLMEQLRILTATDAYTSSLRAAHVAAAQRAAHSESGLAGVLAPESALEVLAPESALVLAKYVMKCADISNIARPFGVSRVWARRLKREFAAQGRLEQARGIAVSPLNAFEGESEDANDEDGFVPGTVPAMVLGFMQFLGVGAFELLADALPSNDRSLGFGFARWARDQVVKNQRLWLMSRDVELAAAAAAVALVHVSEGKEEEEEEDTENRRSTFHRSASSRGASGRGVLRGVATRETERRYSDPKERGDKENRGQHNTNGHSGHSGPLTNGSGKTVPRRRFSCPATFQVNLAP